MADASTSLGLSAAGASTGADSAKPTATKAFMALQIVSAGAHGVRNTVLNDIPDVQSDDPDVQSQMQKVQAGVADLKAKLGTAQQTADIWINTLCAEIAQTIPNHLLDYGATYSAASGQILGLLDQAKDSNSDPSLKTQALETIGLLRDQVASYRTEMDKAKADLSAYAARIQTDHDNLLGGSDSIQQLMSIDSREVDNFTQDIQHMHDEIDAFNKQIMEAEIGTGLSIFVACVGAVLCFVPGAEGAGGAMVAVGAVGLTASAAIWGTLEQKVKACQTQINEDQGTQTALNQQLIALSSLHKTVATALAQISDAQMALSDLSVFWGTFEASLGDVINDLNKPNATLSATIDEIWVRAAQNNWNNLTTFAQALVGASVSSEYRQAA